MVQPHQAAQAATGPWGSRKRSKSLCRFRLSKLSSASTSFARWPTKYRRSERKRQRKPTHCSPQCCIRFLSSNLPPRLHQPEKLAMSYHSRFHLAVVRLTAGSRKPCLSLRLSKHFMRRAANRLAISGCRKRSISREGFWAKPFWMASIFAKQQVRITQRCAIQAASK